jgi:hypothetical protein
MCAFGHTRRYAGPISASTASTLLTSCPDGSRELSLVSLLALEGLLTANCDGPVAAEAISFTYDDLVANTKPTPPLPDISSRQITLG